MIAEILVLNPPFLRPITLSDGEVNSGRIPCRHPGQFVLKHTSHTPLFDHRRCASMHQEASRPIVPVSHAWEFLSDIGTAQLPPTTDCTTAVTQERERSSRQ